MEAATPKKREWGVVGGREIPLREMAENGTKMTEACSVAYTSTTEYFLWKLENCGTTHMLPGANIQRGFS